MVIQWEPALGGLPCIYVGKTDFARQIAWRAAGWRRGNVVASFCQDLSKCHKPEATMACQDGQLCARLKSVIYSAVHRVQDLWGGNFTTED